MEVVKENGKVADAIKYFKGYNTVSGLIASADFNKKLAEVLNDLEIVVKDRDDKVKKLSEDLKKKYVDQYKISEFPWFETDADYVALDIDDRKMISEFNKEFDETLKELEEDEVEFKVLKLTDGDIQSQVAVGKKYKERGFQTTPLFYKLLADQIK